MLTLRLQSPLFGLLAVTLVAGSSPAQRNALAPDEGPPLARPLPEPLVGISASDSSQHLHLDEPGDGSLWARTEVYKAHFDGGGATYIPFLGSDAPRNYPVRFRLESVTLGEEPVPFDSEATPKFEGETVRYERGSLQELWELRLREVEQLFVFDRLGSRRGDLVLRVDVESSLPSLQTANRLEFANGRGGVSYSKAIVLDARGDWAHAPTSLEAGGIEIRVPADFLDRAVFPLTVDPVVSTFPINVQAANDLQPDVAFDQTTSRYIVCWQRAWSATDHDIRSELYTGAGNPIAGSTTYIDATADDWRKPTVANNQFANQFLVVAEEGPDGSRRISGRTRQASSNSMGPQIQISGTEVGEKLNPDVGGNPSNTAGTYYCVVWERVYFGGDIHLRLVRPDSTLLGISTTFLENSGLSNGNPSISKSCGQGPSASQDWNVVWERALGSVGQIRGAQVHWNGTITSPAFQIEWSEPGVGSPSATSYVDAGLGFPRAWLVAYERTGPSNADIYAKLFVGHTEVWSYNLTSLVGASPAANPQAGPVAVSNGCQFSVAYSERVGSFPFPVGNWDVFIDSFYLAGYFASDVLRVSEGRQAMATSGSVEDQVELFANRSAMVGTTNRSLFGIWRDRTFTLTNGNIEGALYELLPGYGTCLSTSYCGPANPNSSGLAAQIVATGSAHPGEPLNLLATNLPTQEFGYFLASPNPGFFSPPASQGFLCLGSPIARFNLDSQIGFTGPSGLFTLDIDTANIPLSPPTPVLPGETWHFQAWFRDGATSNLTDGIWVAFQ